MRLKKLCFFFLLLSSFYIPNAVASNFSAGCCSPCCDWCSGWTVYADWLYWRTRRCDLDYAVPFTITGTAVGSVHEVEPRYDHGFRVGVQKECGCFFFDAFYTHFRNRERDSVTDPAGSLAGTRLVPLFPDISQGLFSFARGDWRIHYDTLDVLGGYKLSDCCCFQTYAFGGFKFARIDQRFDIRYAGSVVVEEEASLAEVTEKIDMRAYGIDVGFGFNYDILSCFNFFGRFSYDVLIGDFRRRFVYDTTLGATPPLVTAIDLSDDCWRMVSVFNLSFGLGYNYHFCNCCLSTLGIAIGYEFHQWVNVPDFLDLIDDGSIITFDRHLQSLGFDGLFIRASIGF